MFMLLFVVIVCVQKQSTEWSDTMWSSLHRLLTDVITKQASSIVKADEAMRCEKVIRANLRGRRKSVVGGVTSSAAAVEAHVNTVLDVDALLEEPSSGADSDTARQLRTAAVTLLGLVKDTIIPKLPCSLDALNDS